MRTTAVVFVLAWAVAAVAHPGVGIVADGRGNIYYTDLKQVWRVTPDGTRAVVVPNVHTHELTIDRAGNLFGEHLRYEGEATNRWWHYIWRRSPDGRIERIVAEHAPFHNEDAISLVRDAAGNSYWANRDAKAIMRGRSVMARGTFRDIRWMTVTPAGVVYLIDTTDLVRVAPDGTVKTIARNLSSTSILRPDISLQHALMGLWTDRSGNVYVADYARGAVKRVAPDGRVTTEFESSLPWSPTGGTFTPNGDLWLLEYSITNDARVRKVTPR